MKQRVKISVCFFLLLFSIQSFNEMEFSIDNYRQYIINTPDENTITIFKIPFENVDGILNKYKISEEKVNLGLFKHKVFDLSNGMILFEKTLNQSYYFLFPDKREYQKFVTGETYWSVSVHFDKKDNANSIFIMKTDKAYEFIQRSVRSDSSYSVNGDSLKYVLYYLPNGNVCYLTPRINNWYDGYWFNSYKEFYYVFNQVFNP